MKTNWEEYFRLISIKTEARTREHLASMRCHAMEWRANLAIGNAEYAADALKHARFYRDMARDLGEFANPSQSLRNPGGRENLCSEKRDPNGIRTRDV
jgi:hypothetical protein